MRAALLVVLVASHAWAFSRCCECPPASTTTTTGGETTTTATPTTTTEAPTTTTVIGPTTTTEAGSTTTTTTVATTTTTSTTTSSTTTTTALAALCDNFERASLGANWGSYGNDPGWGNSDPLLINSTDFGSAHGPDGAAFTAFGTWLPDLPATVAYTCAQIRQGPIATGSSGNWGGACFAANTPLPDGVNDTALCCFFAKVSATIHLFFYDDEGAHTDLGAVTFTPGEYIGIERTGASTYQCATSPDGTTWTPVGAVQTAPGGRVADHYGIAGSMNDTSTGLTNEWSGMTWGAGPGALPTSTPCGQCPP